MLPELHDQRLALEQEVMANPNPIQMIEYLQDFALSIRIYWIRKLGGLKCLTV
jgi:hypothetical protein